MVFLCRHFLQLTHILCVKFLHKLPSNHLPSILCQDLALIIYLCPKCIPPTTIHVKPKEFWCIHLSRLEIYIKLYDQVKLFQNFKIRYQSINHVINNSMLIYSKPKLIMYSYNQFNGTIQVSRLFILEIFLKVLPVYHPYLNVVENIMWELEKYFRSTVLQSMGPTVVE